MISAFTQMEIWFSFYIPVSIGLQSQSDIDVYEGHLLRPQGYALLPSLTKVFSKQGYRIDSIYTNSWIEQALE